MTRLLALLMLAVFSGCALIPSTKTSQNDAKAAGSAAASYEAMVRTISSGTPPPVINISNVCVMGTNNHVLVGNFGGDTYARTVDYDGSGGLTSESSFTWSKLSKNIIPWGIRLILAGLGILLLIWVWKYAKKNSAALTAVTEIADRRVAEFARTADAKLQKRIDEHQAAAAAETDPAEIGYHQQRVAALQAERADLANASLRK